MSRYVLVLRYYDSQYSAWRGRLTVRTEYQLGVAGSLHNQAKWFIGRSGVDW